MISMNYITIYVYYFLLNLLFFPLITFDISPFCCCCNQSGSYKETRYTNITHGDNENIDYTNFKQIYNFKNVNKYVDDESNFYYNKLLEKYLAGRKVDSIETTLIKNSANCCVEVKINNSDVVYIKKDKKINELYIDILKHLDYCELDYIYESDYILTKKVQNDINFVFEDNQNTIDTIYNVFNNTENLLPYFTIAAFLQFQDCGIKLNNSQFKINEDGKYIVKALDINVYDYEKRIDNLFKNILIKSYYDFYIVLNGGFYMFTGIKELFTELMKHDNSYLKKFYYFLHKRPEELIGSLPSYCTNELKDLIKGKELTCIRVLTPFFLIDNFMAYLKDKKFINDDSSEIKYTDLIEILTNKYKGNFKDFFKDYNIFLIKRNYISEDYFDNYEDDELELLNAKKGSDICETHYNVLEKLFEKTENCFNLLYQFEKLYNFFGDVIQKITPEDEKELINKFALMLDFLIDNRNNPKYDKTCYQKIINYIKKIKGNGLFKFLFNNTNIETKLKLL